MQNFEKQFMNMGGDNGTDTGMGSMGGSSDNNMTISSMSMPMMFLHFGYHEQVLFGAWVISDEAGFFGVFFFTIVLAVLKAAIRKFTMISQANAKLAQFRHGDVKIDRVSMYKARFPTALAAAADSFVHWILMLVVMTFNAGFIFAAVFGTFLGYIFFEQGGDICEDVPLLANFPSCVKLEGVY
ncbi:hypothetical protein HDU76_000819 [Blyttiomyces sp. JEL0837]|nr:hypothetical protein HDU76_000819 [Blyttiomyces sp. JEL0837]